MNAAIGVGVALEFDGRMTRIASLILFFLFHLPELGRPVEWCFTHLPIAHLSTTTGSPECAQCSSTRPAQRFASSLGAVWVGGSDACPPEPLDAAMG